MVATSFKAKGSGDVGSLTTVVAMVVAAAAGEDGTGLIEVALGNGAVMDASAAGMILVAVVVIFGAGAADVTVTVTGADDTAVAAAARLSRCCRCTCCFPFAAIDVMSLVYQDSGTT